LGDKRWLWAKLYSAGISLRFVKSPLAPKTTTVHAPQGAAAVSTSVAESVKTVESSQCVSGPLSVVACASSAILRALSFITERLKFLHSVYQGTASAVPHRR